MKKLWAVFSVGLFLFCSLQAEKCKQYSEKCLENVCTTATCFVDLLQCPQILGRTSVKKLTIPCETDFPQKGSNVLDVSSKATTGAIIIKKSFRKSLEFTMRSQSCLVNPTPLRRLEK